MSKRHGAAEELYPLVIRLRERAVELPYREVDFSKSARSDLLLGLLFTRLSHQRSDRPARHPAGAAISDRSGPVSRCGTLLVCAVTLLAFREFAYAGSGSVDRPARVCLRV